MYIILNRLKMHIFKILYRILKVSQMLNALPYTHISMDWKFTLYSVSAKIVQQNPFT